MKTQAVIFDFDGVLLPDSEHVKEITYQKLFPGKEEEIAALLPVIKKRWSGGKGSRKDIIRDLAQSIGIEKIEPLIEEFSHRVEEKLKYMECLPTTRKTLAELSRSLLLFLSSATPEEELNARVETLGIKKYFRKIYGSPTSKIEAIKHISADYHLAPSNIIFVGDTYGDLEAAMEAGTRFVGVQNRWNDWREKECVTISADHLDRLLPLLD